MPTVFENVVDGLSGRKNISWSQIANFSHLDEETKLHLKNVYLALSATVLAAAGGVLAQIKYAFNPQIAGILTVVVLLWLMFTPYDSGDQTKRIGLLLLFGALKGASIGGLVHVALVVDSTIVSKAFLGTVAVFLAFSLSALFAKRRSWLFLGGMLWSALMVMLVSSLLGLLFGGKFFFGLNLYLGLLVFCGYVIYDTQLLIERAQYSKDYVGHAVELFIDFVAIFVRILIILMKKKKDNED